MQSIYSLASYRKGLLTIEVKLSGLSGGATIKHQILQYRLERKTLLETSMEELRKRKCSVSQEGSPEERTYEANALKDQMTRKNLIIEKATKGKRGYTQKTR